MGHNEEEQIPYHAKSLPPRLPAFDTILYGHVKWIEEYGTRFLKAHAMLALVGEVFGLVPLESHAFHVTIVIINL
jgi:hypothetical protein